MSGKQSGHEKAEPARMWQRSRVTLSVKLDKVKLNKNGEQPVYITRYLGLPPTTV